MNGGANRITDYCPQPWIHLEFSLAMKLPTYSILHASIFPSSMWSMQWVHFKRTKNRTCHLGIHQYNLPYHPGHIIIGHATSAYSRLGLGHVSRAPIMTIYDTVIVTVSILGTTSTYFICNSYFIVLSLVNIPHGYLVR